MSVDIQLDQILQLVGRVFNTTQNQPTNAQSFPMVGMLSAILSILGVFVIATVKRRRERDIYRKAKRAATEKEELKHVLEDTIIKHEEDRSRSRDRERKRGYSVDRHRSSTTNNHRLSEFSDSDD